MLYDLLDTEGLYLGASSALNVVAAVELAQKLGPGSLSFCYLFSNSENRIHREDGRHDPVRRRLPVPEPAFLQEVAPDERARECYPRPSQEIRCTRLEHAALVQFNCVIETTKRDVFTTR